MGKVEVSALIKAIQESVSLLVSDGLAARPKITDPVVDATYVEGLESGYSDEIDEIVDNIPDVPPTPPAPTFPNVTADTAMVGPQKISVQAGSSANLYKDSALIPYDSTKLYGGIVGDGDGGVSTWQFLFINNSGYLAVKNTTSTGIYAFGLNYYICSSNQAEIVFVLNSSDVKYQAFKYTQNGIDYYYVLDGVQSDWTDDLSSIGYSLEPIGLYAYFNRNNPGVNTSLFGSNEGSTQYNRLYEKDGSGSTSEMSFDPSYTYTVLHVYEADGTEVLPSDGRFELGDSRNYLRLLFFNGGPSWVAAKIEYTKSSTEMTAYFNSGIKNNQKSVSSSWGPYGGTTELLYPLNSSQFIPYDSTKIYKVKTVFYVNGTNPVTITNDSVTIDDKNMNGNHTGHLMIHTHNPNPATGNVCGCTFTAE